jgi:hypothetical protein
VKLDTHLYNLLAQYFETDNPVEQRRLEELALVHLEQRKRVSRVTALRTWAVIIDAFGATKWPGM